jgi:hypothetical protein
MTPEARDLMKRYQAVAAEAEAALLAVFDRHFSDWVDPILSDIDGSEPAE